MKIIPVIWFLYALSYGWRLIAHHWFFWEDVPYLDSDEKYKLEQKIKNGILETISNQILIPGKLFGGVPKSANEAIIRIDYVQHSISAVLNFNDETFADLISEHENIEKWNLFLFEFFFKFLLLTLIFSNKATKP